MDPERGRGMSDLFFGINMQKLLRLGVLERVRAGLPPAPEDAQLSSEELLFCRLWASDTMHSQIFQKGEPLVREGQRLEQAYIVFQGQALASCAGTQFHLGPGAVIGLAEALTQQACRWSVSAQSMLHTRSIPIAAALDDIRGSHPGLRSICRVTVARILNLAEVPAQL